MMMFLQIMEMMLLNMTLEDMKLLITVKEEREDVYSLLRSEKNLEKKEWNSLHNESKELSRMMMMMTWRLEVKYIFHIKN